MIALYILFSKPELTLLIQNGQSKSDKMDHIPAAKLYIPRTSYTWLLTELNPANPTKGFALVDHGNSVITFDEIDVDDIVRFGIQKANLVRRDPYFAGRYPIQTYIHAALTYGFITDQEVLLAKWIPKKPPGPSPF